MPDIFSPIDHQDAWRNFIQWSITSRADDPHQHERIHLASDHIFSKILSNSSNNVVISLMDVRTQQYRYLSPNATEVMGWPCDEIIAGGVRYTFDRIHPHDIPAAINFSEHINKYYEALHDQQKELYCGQWDYRVRNRQGVYTKFIQKDHVLKRTAEGRIEEYLVFFRKIENYKSHDSQHLRLTNGSENLFYKHDHKVHKTYCLERLSAREMEVAQLISKSRTLKDIAITLGISFNTVKNHSNNILRKLEAKDSMEAISLLRIFGFM